MASVSELGAENVDTKWVVGPTEDVVQALLETLVDPFLPLRPSIEPPSIDAQKSVSKQMHAVVLLYNYHHRKQKPELKFLDFPYFCQLALVIRPRLIAFMKLFKQNESMDINGTEDHLSLTEKAIKDACDISSALDASKNVPDIEGWPISKIAILLIDSNKENGFVQFEAVTKGSWSPIEIELNESNINQELSSNDNESLQLMFDAVKDVTGINSFDLEVLETHVTYSSSRKRSAARFYMMQYCGCFSTKEQVPLETLVKSLRGLLAEKLQYGLWRTTRVIEYHHMLPYVEFISCWLSRKDSRVPSPARDLPLSNPEMKKISSDKAVKKEESVEYPKMLGIKSGESHKGPLGPVGPLSGPSTWLHKLNMSEHANTFPKSEDTTKKLNSPLKVYHHRKRTNSSAPHNERKDGFELKVDSLKSCDTKRKDEKLSIDDGNITTSNNQIIIAEKTRQLVGYEDKRKYNVKVQSAQELQNALALHIIGQEEELSSKVYHHRKRPNLSTQHDARKDGVKLKVDMDSLKPCDNQRKDEKLSIDNRNITTSNNQIIIAEKKEQLVEYEDKRKYNVKVQSAQDSQELQNALALLRRQREELVIHTSVLNSGMQDKLASYEDIIARIRDGGEVGLVRKCIESIITGNDHLLTEPEKNGSGLSKTFVLGKSACQDLEYICLKNNWRYPRYFTEPSAGTFVSNVIVGKKDLKFSAKGRSETKPCEARESAAANMIAKLRDQAN